MRDPEIVHFGKAHMPGLETALFQAFGDEALAAAVLRSHRRAADQFFGKV